MRSCLLALLAVVSPTLDGFAQPAPKKPGAQPTNEVEVRLADGSRVRMTILQERLDIVTKYGPLSVPTAEIRRIDFGIHPTEAVRRHIAECIGKLGSASFKERERGNAELQAIGAPAYIALYQAIKSPDLETAHRAKLALEQIRQKVPEEQLRVREDDLIQTADFTVVGRITAPAIRASTSIFGEAKLKVADLRSIRWLGGIAEVELTIDGTKYASGNTWLDTGIMVGIDDDLTVTASGQIDLMSNGAGQCVTGPAGSNQWGMGRGGAAQPAGALLGKIGDNGVVFVVGENYKSLSKKEGRLFLQIAPGPWNNPGAPITGSYKVNITGGRDTMDRQ